MNRILTGFALSGVVGLGLSLSAAPVAAQSKSAPTEAAARSDADKAAKEGERLLGQHDAAGALVELGKAYNLSHNPRFLLPMGLAYAEADRPLDALDALGRYLKDAPAVPDAKRKEIGAKFAVMLDQVAALVTLDASRQNAQVKIDGRVMGTTPIETPLRLLPGKHEILMMPAPTDPSSGARVLIEVRPGERRTIKLEPGARSRFLEPQSQNQTGGDMPDEPATRLDGSGQPGLATATPVGAGSGSDSKWHPLYKSWRFWTIVGSAAAVTLVGVGIGAAVAARSIAGTGSGTTALSAEQFPNVASWQGGPIDARPAALVSVGGFRL